MSRLPMVQAVAADYADAMLVARRAKNWLVFFLVVVLLVQLGIFFAARYTPGFKIRADAQAASSVSGADTKPADAPSLAPIIEHLIDISVFAGMIFAIVLPAILLLILTIMLVGRLVGVSHVTGAFCWSIVFLVLLFPWQSLLDRDVHTLALNPAAPPATQPSTLLADSQDVRIPGVLYTFPELRRHFDFQASYIPVAILGWGRYVGWPIVELIILLVVQGRSRRGLRLALGEAEVQVDAPAT